MPQLDPSSFSAQLFWLAVFFVVLYALLSRALLPRVKSVIDLRANTIGGDLQQAEASRSQAEQVKELYEKSLAEVRAKSKALIADAKAKAAEKSASQQATLDTTLNKQVADSEAGIEKAKQDVMDKLAPVASELAATIVDKLVKRQPDSKEIDAAWRKVEKDKAA